MKKIVSTLVLAATLSFASHSFALTCLCVGINGTGKTCGVGGAGGAFLQIQSVKSTTLKYFLVNTATQAEYESKDKAFDAQTGWFCCNGCLP